MQQIWQAGKWDDSGLVQQASASSFPALLHDTRNLVASIVLYCDLIDESGVLMPSTRPYGKELRLIANASQQLLAAMTAMAGQSRQAASVKSLEQTSFSARRFRLNGGGNPVESLAGEVKANQSLLSALAGPGISISVTLSGGAEAISMSAENLSRILINLTRNAAEAMGGKGRILIAVEQTGSVPTVREPSSCAQRTLQLTFADSGPGIPVSALEAVFSPGYTTHLGHDAYDQPESFAYDSDSEADVGQAPELAEGRGLGLSIVRSLVASAGGTVRAVSHAANLSVSPSAPGAESLTGAAIVLEFPILSTRSQPAQSETNVPCPLPANVTWNEVQGTHAAT